MEETPHGALTGEGALEFALNKGYSSLLEDPNKLKGQGKLDERFNNFDTFVTLHYEGGPVPAVVPDEGDTVSAVAMDRSGYLACANSTGKNWTPSINGFS